MSQVRPLHSVTKEWTITSDINNVGISKSLDYKIKTGDIKWTIRWFPKGRNSKKYKNGMVFYVYSQSKKNQIMMKNVHYQ